MGEICNHFFKVSAFFVAPYLTSFASLSFLTGKFSKQLNYAKVLALHKLASKSNCNTHTFRLRIRLVTHRFGCSAGLSVRSTSFPFLCK